MVRVLAIDGQISGRMGRGAGAGFIAKLSFPKCSAGSSFNRVEPYRTALRDGNQNGIAGRNRGTDEPDAVFNDVFFVQRL